MLRVLLVDNHRLLRHGVRHVVEQAGAVVSEAGTGEAALKALTSEPFDLAIIDLTLPDVTGLDLVRRVHARRPELPIVVLSLHGAEHVAQQAFSAGALAYLTKDTAPAELIEAIKVARHGRQYLSPQTREGLVEAPRHRTLSTREFQIMRMLAEGRTVSEAAAELGISVKTASTYRARMLDKLGMKTNAQVMRYALRQRLVD